MITTTKYYEEFLRYSQMAKTQQKESNLGNIPHTKGSIKDNLMKNVKLYDVVERKYAGFTQVILDMWYGNTKAHPYHAKLSGVRLDIAKNFTGWRAKRTLPEMLFVFLVHRLTGSGINYAKSPSGYHNTILPEFYKAQSIKDMVKIIQSYNGPMYTSVGYQFPAFPKPTGSYKRGGDFFMCTMLPKLAQDLANYLEKGEKKDFREIGNFMFAWNKKLGLSAYKFQYAAFISDVADFYPKYVNLNSPFYYGKNAIECIQFMATSQLRGEKFFDAVMDKAIADTGYTAYNIEDQMCDCIRWIENYIRPGSDYDHLDRDKIWSSSKIIDHPFGRQKKMLELGLIKSFNDINRHPSDDFIIKLSGITVEDYQQKVRSKNGK